MKEILQSINITAEEEQIPTSENLNEESINQ